MEDNLDVNNSEQSSSSQTEDAYPYLNDDGSVNQEVFSSGKQSKSSNKATVKKTVKTSADVKENSSISDVTENSSNSKEELAGNESEEESGSEAKDSEDKQEKKAVEDSEKKVPGKQENRRMRELVERTNQAEKARQQIEFELERLKASYNLLKSQAEANSSRFQKLATETGRQLSPEQIELEQYKFNEQITNAQRELETQFIQKQAQLEQKARVDAKAEKLVSQMEEALNVYGKTVGKVELAHAFKDAFLADPNVKAIDVAKRLHEERKKAYQDTIAAEMKVVQNAPKPIRQNGTIVKKRGPRTVEDIIADLDAEFGDDWNVRK